MTHKELVMIGARWCNSRCNIVLAEFVCMNSEICDVLGFSSRDTLVLEAKVSRSDFLRDKRKNFRYYEENGLGNYRFYIAPKGLIDERELPDGWGMVEVYPSGAARMTVHALRKDSSWRAERRVFYSIARRAQIRGMMPKILETLAQGSVYA